MTRITKAAHERMAKALTIHALDARAAELIAESVDLFYTLHDREHPVAIRKHMDVIIAVKPKAFKQRCGFDINLSGKRFAVGSRGIGDYWRANAGSRPSLCDIDPYPGVGIGADDVLHDRLSAFFDAEAALKADSKAFYSEALGTVSQFTTVKSLRESWPESLSVIEHLLPEDNRLLPVVEVKHLNDRFGLPAVAAA